MRVYLEVEISDSYNGIDEFDPYVEENIISDLVDEVESIALNEQEQECEDCSSCGGHSVEPRVDNVTVLSEADLHRRFGPGQVIGATTGRPQW